MKLTITKFIIPILFILLWQASTAGHGQNFQILPSPVKVFLAIINLFREGQIITDILVSLKHVLIGFLIASPIGIAVGIVLGYSKTAKKLLAPLIEFIRPIPPIAWIPLAILWFGIGDNPAYFLVFLGAFFPIMTNAYFGVVSVEENYKRAALSLGAGKKEIMADIILPAASPSIFTGLKTGLGISWFMVITAELVGSQSGLGYMIQLNRLLLHTDKVIAGMVIIGICGYFMNKTMEILEDKLLPWRPTS
ncbi:MAG: ABC transporter permease [Patescibacteria group bacterium]|nr:ABC transporter permease [Patescibacteria group bacterium]